MFEPNFKVNAFNKHIVSYFSFSIFQFWLFFSFFDIDYFEKRLKQSGVIWCMYRVYLMVHQKFYCRKICDVSLMIFESCMITFFSSCISCHPEWMIWNKTPALICATFKGVWCLEIEWTRGCEFFIVNLRHDYFRFLW